MVDTTSQGYGNYPDGGFGFGHGGIFQLIIWIIFIWILLMILGTIFRPVVY